MYLAVSKYLQAQVIIRFGSIITILDKNFNFFLKNILIPSLIFGMISNIINALMHTLLVYHFKLGI